MKLILGHTLDPDDVFMFHIFKKLLQDNNFEIIEVLLDIESLNKLALYKLLDFTAISVYTYGLVYRHYYLCRFGMSYGLKYGPILVSKEQNLNQILNDVIAIPGEHTTASLLLKLVFGKNVKTVEISFQEIPKLVINNVVKAGVLIHELQLTYEKYGLKKVFDFGEWWWNETKLPLPLGVNVVRKELGFEICKKLSNLLGKAINEALNNIDEVIEYALVYSREKEVEIVKKFIKMYVHRTEIEPSNELYQAISKLFKYAFDEKLLPELPEIEIV